MNKNFELAVKREYGRMKRDLEPRVIEALKRHPPGAPTMEPDTAVGVMVTQNLLRDCMIVAMNMANPQPRQYFIELATRLAGYAITALPFDEHEEAALIVRDGLLGKLADMQAAGHVLKTEWGD